MNTSNRREALKAITGGTAIAAFTSSFTNRFSEANKQIVSLNGKINHSVCRWCYGSVPLNDLAKASKEMGISSIELLTVEDFKTVQKHGLTCAIAMPTMPNGWGIPKGWNKKEHHAQIIEDYKKAIDEVSAVGLNQLICFSGNRNGMSDDEGAKNCIEGLKQIMAYAEKKKVTMVMELLNSKVDHKDYMCDHTKWGVEVAKGIGSERFKLLYDIYHMQIMEGDVIRTIKESKDYISHYHTGGVPGRHEIDDSQELNYPAIMKAIVETGYKGHVAQEFIPAKTDKLASLKQSITICDI